MSLEFLPVLTGLWASYLAYLLMRRNLSFLSRRLRKTQAKTKVATFYKSVLELVRPLSSVNISNKKSKNKIKVLLQSLGVPSNDDDILEFENKRLLSVLIVAAICTVFLYFSTDKLVIYSSVLVCYLTYKHPEFHIQSIIRKRRKEFERFFPDAIDLLSVCVEAGLGIDAAIERVAEDFTPLSNAVGREFTRLSKDVMSGLSREEAFKNMAKRVQTTDLQSFAAMITQSEKMGTSISQSLKVYCETLRLRKKQRVEELVQSASSKMTIPMVLFLLPALFIVIMYPAMIKIMESMGK